MPPCVLTGPGGLTTCPNEPPFVTVSRSYTSHRSRRPYALSRHPTLPSFQILSALNLPSAPLVHYPQTVAAASQQFPPTVGSLRSSPQQPTRPSTPSWPNAYPLLAIQPHAHAVAERGAMSAAATSAVATSAVATSAAVGAVTAFVAAAPSPPTLLSSNFHLSPAATPPRLPAHVAEVRVKPFTRGSAT